MGGFLSYLLTYIIGGLTFIPLVLVCVLWHGTRVVDVGIASKHGDVNHDAEHELGHTDVESSKLPAGLQKREKEHDAAAGYFAVCREYVPGGVNGKPPERLTPAGEVIAVESPSVYQSMYRSIFERNKAQGPSFEASGGTAKATKKARNVFYVVLRLGHLMLYDNADQLEVRHVISLGLYDVDIYGGGDSIPEGELWVKRNCVRLRRKNADGTHQDSKPYFLFSDNCSDKEDFYLALVQNRNRSSSSSDVEQVQPLKFAPEHMVKLVQQLHASEELMQNRWFNALLGRIFLSLYKTSEIQGFIHRKISKKLTRVPKPGFVEDVKVGRIDMGSAAPAFINPKLRELTLDGELILEADVKYSGNFRLEIAAVVQIDLGKRFGVRKIDILLAGLCKSLQGHLLVKLKPPPSNRLWISFETMPKIDLSIEPIVSSRQITWGLILRTIESRIREVVGDTLVLPNWDDVPFSDTEKNSIRGGIFETDAHDYKPPPEAPQDIAEAAVEAAERSDVMAGLKSQSASSLIRRKPVGVSNSGQSVKEGVEGAVSSSRGSPSAQSMPRVMRKSSFASASIPVVSASPEHVSAFREDGPQGFTDAASTMKGFNTRNSSLSSTPPADGQALIAKVEEPSSMLKETDEQDVFDMEMPVDETPPKTGEPAKLGRAGHQSHASLDGFGNHTADDFEKKRSNIVVGAAIAATAARKWGYDLVAKRGSLSSNDSASDTASLQNIPVGRGQPLPPPGQPLPGPAKKSWATALGSIGKKRPGQGSPSIPSYTDPNEASSMAARDAADIGPSLPRRPTPECGKSLSGSPSLHSRNASVSSLLSGSASIKTMPQRRDSEPPAKDSGLGISTAGTELIQVQDMALKEAGPTKAAPTKPQKTDSINADVQSSSNAKLVRQKNSIPAAKAKEVPSASADGHNSERLREQSTSHGESSGKGMASDGDSEDEFEQFQSNVSLDQSDAEDQDNGHQAASTAKAGQATRTSLDAGGKTKRLDQEARVGRDMAHDANKTDQKISAGQETRSDEAMQREQKRDRESLEMLQSLVS